MDYEKTYLEEHKRLKGNKKTQFEFLVEEKLLTEALRAKLPSQAQATLLRYIEMGGACGRNLRVHHLTKSTASVKTREENAMEEDVDDDGLYSDEDWPMPFDEPRGTQYITVKVFWCEAQQEWQLEY